MAVGIKPFWGLSTSLSAKNLKTRSQSSKASDKTQNFPNKIQHIFTPKRQEPDKYLHDMMFSKAIQ
jgi:hypothetical protein